MNILFLTLLEFGSLSERNLYTDLLREFVKNGHTVCVISPVEKRKGQDTHLVAEENVRILRLRIGNTQKTNVIEKGISTVMIEPSYRKAVQEYFSDIKFDLVLYSTPPVTLTGAVEYVKARDNAKTYLLLKDIFPQNAVDIGMMQTGGAKGLLYRHFRSREKDLYRISDRIGCMSQANADYLLAHNPEIRPENVEVCPNSIEICDMSIDSAAKAQIRAKYNLPQDKKIFVYGGNLGKPQDISFIIQCLRAAADTDAFFLIVGSGTEYHLLMEYEESSAQANFRLIQSLPKEEYDMLAAACDIGLLFLDHRFTIPNFPSRLLSYMQAKLPVLAATDRNTDVGKVITDNGFGWWCESTDAGKFRNIVSGILDTDLDPLRQNAWDALCRLYDVKSSYEIINRFMQNDTI